MLPFSNQTNSDDLGYLYSESAASVTEKIAVSSPLGTSKTSDPSKQICT